MGAIADRLTVDPQTGAIKHIENLAITHQTTRDSDYEDHLVRVIGTVKVITVLDGVLNGSAYLGGYHGISALHGLKGDCQCRSDFDEHAHYIGCDSSGDAYGCWDGQVYGLAMSPDGNVWAGDRHFVQLLDQQNTPPDNYIMGQHFLQAIDVFPGLRDEVHGLAVDGNGGVWVASDGDGLAYLDPAKGFQAGYWSQATTLPQNHLHGAALDQGGDLWIGTRDGGVARFDAGSNKWTYYTTASGLPNDSINTVYVDQFAKSRRVFIATQSGFSIYSGQ
jgi:hypothetical protein